ncbi:MAG: hypothetical protein WA160_08955 [Pseudobdellovibrio sp.]
MTQVDEIERLQIELNDNPKSFNFVRLAEIYIERKMITEAAFLVNQSLKFHPNSVSGQLLLGRIFHIEKKLDQSLTHLDKATRLASENWKAWLEKAEVFTELKNGKEALKCYKKVLFLNPNHPIARRAVSKLEVLTADEYEDDLFSMQPLQKADLKDETAIAKEIAWPEIKPALERVLALVDALTVRLDTKKAIDLLNDCTSKYGNHPEIESRRLRLSTYDNSDFILPKKQKSQSLAKQELVTQKKLAALNELLRRIELKQTDRLST